MAATKEKNIVKTGSATGWKSVRRNIKVGNLPADTDFPNPVIWNKFLVSATCSPQTITCQNRTTGDILWKRVLGSHGPSIPVVSKNGKAFIPTNSSIECIDVVSGESLWSYHPPVVGNETFYAKPLINTNRLYIGTTTGAFFCLATRTGKPLWHNQLTRNGQMVNGTAAAINDMVVVGTNVRAVFALDAQSGAVRWKTRLNANCTSQTFELGGLVVVQTTNTVYFLRPSDGHVMHRWQRKGWTVRHATKDKQSLILQITAEPFDYKKAAIRNIPETPQQLLICICAKATTLWESGLPDFCWGIRHIPKTNYICVAAPRRHILFKASTGQYQFTIPVGSASDLNPSLPDFADGTLYTQSGTGSVYAFTLPG